MAGAVASTANFPVAPSAELQRPGKDMSKHEAVPAPVEEYEYAQEMGELKASKADVWVAMKDFPQTIHWGIICWLAHLLELRYVTAQT